MTTKKTRFSTNRNRATEERAAIDTIIDGLRARTPDNLHDDDFEDLSDLSRAAASRLAERWHEIEYTVRLALVREMVNRFETSVEHHFDRALTAALSDPESDVRLLALEGLSDTNDSVLLNYLLQSIPQEQDAAVRAAEAEILGQYVLEAEMQRLDTGDVARLRELVLSLARTDPDRTVRLRMVETAGYFAGDPDVIKAIEDAWSSGEHESQVSALRAMGRQGDSRWVSIVVAQFQHDEPEIRFEAARSAGTIGGQSVVPRLIDLTEDDDVEVQMAAIASLGEIGGDLAVTALRNLEHSESMAIADAASAALEAALLLDNVTRPPSSLW